MAEESQDTTHFGFKTIAKSQKEDMVAHVFHSVAAKYDVMNDLMSFGIHRLWKRFTIDCSGVRRGQTVLDLAGGTGDLTAKFSRMVGETGRFVGRFGVIIPVMAIAGTLVNKKIQPTTTGTLPTHGALFVGLLIGTVLLVGALTFIPALALGPVAEYLSLR